MDFTLLGLLAVLAAVIALGSRHQARLRRAPGHVYQRVFSVGAGGLLFLVSGLVGWDLRDSHGWFRGTNWVDGPIWSQVGFGLALLLLAGAWARRAGVPSNSPVRE